jgi:chemotaxis protein MotB
VSGHGGDDGGLPEEHEEHANHEAWVIPYADLLTLLMAMFIALFAMSTVDTSKFKALAIGFNEALNGPSLDSGVFSKTPGDSPLDGGSGAGVSPQQGGAVGPDNKPTSNKVLASLAEQNANLQAQKSVETKTLKGVEKKIQTAAKEQGLAGKLSLRLEERGLVVTVVTDQVLFDAGSAALKPEGEGVLRIVERALAAVDNPILIEGHTDSNPIASSQYPSNWELSGGRAASVARFFQGLGMDPKRLRPEGLGEQFPIASNDTVEGRAKNRRVEIVVQSKLVDQALRNAGLSNKPASNESSDQIGDAVGSPISDPVNQEIAPTAR